MKWLTSEINQQSGGLTKAVVAVTVSNVLQIFFAITLIFELKDTKLQIKDISTSRIVERMNFHPTKERLFSCYA